ncbi:MAG: sigma-54-dependent Fis family transcriptional regulator [Kiritimatiellaeota bacterium]|nr:sigma-54-dependent Fis family transcriptional regulator [Kiritimatiellota bacterium]
MSKARILIVDDERIKRTVLVDRLNEAGYDTVAAENPCKAAPILAKTVFDVVITDLRMPGQDGLSFLRELRERRPEQVVIVVTAYGSVESAVEAMKLGAFDYIQKPFAAEELALKISRALRLRRLEQENEALRNRLASTSPTPSMVGKSQAIREVLLAIHAVAPTETTVLVEGESGVGKELVARTIHACSLRSDGPFVAVSCAALPATIVESELFGHEAGSFTGARRRRAGRFEMASGGTLFLDDVDDTPLEVQVKLLRVLQEKRFERVGGEQSVKANVRIVAATKHPLQRLVATGRFREDLFYRLNVVPVRVPPLRERVEDIPLLMEYFLEQIGNRMGRRPPRLTSEAVGVLVNYSWPGNVRQLEHYLERLVVFNSKPLCDVRELPDLPPASLPTDVFSFRSPGTASIDLNATLRQMESRLLDWALNRAGGNLMRAAKMLGVPRSTLQYRLSRLSSKSGEISDSETSPNLWQSGQDLVNPPDRPES